MLMYSYHIFYFPFKWKIEGRENLLFAEQTNLDNIEWNKYSNWLENPKITDEQEQNELYNEKNYYYEFVHPVLYDTGEKNSILKHFERKEPQQYNVSYIISKRGGKTYTLKIDAMNLNLYATGVGMLTFYLKNEREDQKEPEDILTINQYGRRIFPPFIADLEFRGEIAEYLKIEGLNGEPSHFYEDFSGYTNKEPWKPACFINYLITDLYEGLEITPVVDDRMFVNCWYYNDKLSKKIKEGLNIEKEEKREFHDEDDFWYKFLFLDANYVTCQNSEMRKDLICNQTYKRWQRNGTLYGVSRYSFVAITDSDSFNMNVIHVHMRTVYSRMIELVMIQRASILRFSGEITRVSKLSKEGEIHASIVEQISSLYKEYIRFVNQVHFREVTAQDQGIELYEMMMKTLKIVDYIHDLDNEIGELNQYVHLIDDKIRNKNSAYLNKIATIFLPATLTASLFGMNSIKELTKFLNLEDNSHGEIIMPEFLIQLGIVGIVCLIAYLILKRR